MTVHRARRRYDLQPQRLERFKLSNDPNLEGRVRGAVACSLDLGQLRRPQESPRSVLESHGPGHPRQDQTA